MAQQTINVGASPNDGTGTPLRTAFQYTNSNFSELYTAVGPSGNNIVVPGSATITGDLGVGTASPSTKLEVATATANTRLRINSTSVVATEYFRSGTGLWLVGSDSTNAFKIARGSNFGGSADYFSIGSATADCTWYDGAGGTRMTLNSTGLGVGTSPGVTFDIQSASPMARITGTSTTGYSSLTLRNTGASGRQYGITVGGSGTGAVAGNLVITDDTASATRFVLDSSGNVGIGVTPSAWGSIYRGIQMRESYAAIFSDNGNGVCEITSNAYNDGAWKYASATKAARYQLDAINGQHEWYTAGTGTVGGTITDFATAKMTLDASGVLLVGTTTAPNVGAATTFSGFSINGSGNNAYIASKIDNGTCGYFRRDGTDGAALNFYKANSAVGNISVTASACTFNSTSDYRLKESVQLLTGGLARVSALKPSIYKWKADGSNGEGFIAHELAEVVPAAVSGEKDALNEDGSIKPQGVDMSRVVPILVAAIQELTARVQTLETR